MHPIDWLVSQVSPAAGLRRAHARSVLAELRSYEGAKLGRRTQGWHAPGGTANDAIRGSLPRLVNRSRDVMRNTWWGPRIKSTFVSHAVGSGITPTVKTGAKSASKDATRRAIRVWNDWAKECDAEGQLDINGLIALAAGTIIESGEVLIRRRPTGHTRGKVPLRLQLIEGDQLDTSRTGPLTDQGIDFAADGGRSGYWLLPYNPGRMMMGMARGASARVPANDVLHVYRKDRIGQARGVPWVAPVLLKGRDIADLEEAVIVKAKVEACLTVFVKRAAGSTAHLAQTVTDPRAAAPAAGRRKLENLAPGMINYLDQDEDINAVTPSSSLAFDSVQVNNWMTLAAGAGITYDQLTGDLRQANYSSLRAGKIEFRRLIEQFQWLTLTPMLLDKIWQWFVDAAQDAGVLPRRAGGYPVEWIMPAVEPIDPLKDLQADILAVRSGRMTWSQFVASWGVDPDDQLDEIERWLKDLDAREVVLDADPRRGAGGVKGAAKSDAKPQTDDEDLANAA
ncbi:phage portal protein [Camelimonas fluminis]|uniref:Phage portal protein n=1 Tax=Camelimonas fluminis TaxID=1576911 RepID=A0ABV7UEE7_9HYPH|nr:phage portal protein [Camelimonas fluminis]GHE50950.1 phage portal protein [Camelimonas fluminis]